MPKVGKIKISLAWQPTQVEEAKWQSCKDVKKYLNQRLKNLPHAVQHRAAGTFHSFCEACSQLCGLGI